jgi:hypothetical protein
MRVRLATEPGVSLATSNPGYASRPRWARTGLPLVGDRSTSTVFRLPSEGGEWARRWLYSHSDPDQFDCVAAEAIGNASAQAATVWRNNEPTPMARSADMTNGFAVDFSTGNDVDIYDDGCCKVDTTLRPTVSSNWFLIPYGNINGFTLGIGFVHAAHDVLDRNMTVTTLNDPYSRSGRFIMDEATGEVFITAFRADGTMLIAWTKSLHSCERVRELLLFVTPLKDGEPPTHVLLRNSFYERRDCRICTTPDAHSVDALPRPCTGFNLRRDNVRASAQGNSWRHFNTFDRRFNGHFWGVVEKYRYDRVTRVVNRAERIPILIDIRTSCASVSRMFKHAVRHSALTFGLGPRSSSRVFLVTLTAAQAAIANAVAKPLEPLHPRPSRSSGTAYQRTLALRPVVSKRPRAGKGTTSVFASAASLSISDPEEEPSIGNDSLGDVRRVRNIDTIDRETVLHRRKCRNRASAQKSNALRKARLEMMDSELRHLKEIVPTLISRRDVLVAENVSLRQCLPSLHCDNAAPELSPLDETLPSENVRHHEAMKLLPAFPFPCFDVDWTTEPRHRGLA